MCGRIKPIRQDSGAESAHTATASHSAAPSAFLRLLRRYILPPHLSSAAAFLRGSVPPVLTAMFAPSPRPFDYLRILFLRRSHLHSRTLTTPLPMLPFLAPLLAHSSNSFRRYFAPPRFTSAALLLRRPFPAPRFSYPATFLRRGFPPRHLSSGARCAVCPTASPI
jgi:hypothetical protein